MKLSEIHRDFIIFVGLGLAIGAWWTHVYVGPHDEFRDLVGICLAEKQDYSVQSYRDCVDETRPKQQRTLQKGYHRFGPKLAWNMYFASKSQKLYARKLLEGHDGRWQPEDSQRRSFVPHKPLNNQRHTYSVV